MSEAVAMSFSPGTRMQYKHRQLWTILWVNHQLPVWKEPTNDKKMVDASLSFLKKVSLLRPVHSFMTSAPTSSS
jgi:hypothetical protein